MVALLGVVVLLLAILATIGWVALGALKTMRRTLSRSRFWTTLACMILLPALGLLIGFNLWTRSFYLSVVPWQLDVSSIEYRKEERWGLPFFSLPGDNETGIRIYELPEAATLKLKEQGIAYLQNLPDIPLRPNDRRTRGRYSNWQETPLNERARRDVTNHCDNSEGAFCIKVDEDVWTQTQQILDMPGSYYAVGRTGVIVIDPERRRVIYMYNG